MKKYLWVEGGSALRAVAAYLGEDVSMLDVFGKTLDWAGRIVFVVCGLIILDRALADGAGVFEYVLGGLYFGVAVAYIAALAFQYRWLGRMREDLKERRGYGDD